MVNKYGKYENLIERHGNGVISYTFRINPIGCCFEKTYNDYGFEETYRDSFGVSSGFDKPKEETKTENMKELKELKKIAELKGISLEEQTKESVIDYFISKCLKHKISLDDSVYEKISLFWSKDYVDSLKEIFKNNN